MRTLLTLLICTALFAFVPSQKIDKVKFLAGTWKMENKNEYEIWKLISNSEVKGSAYEIKAGKKVTTEYLAINIVDGNLIYTATVLNQNNSQPIKFKLNNTIKNKISFENPEHDFPKKIQYSKINDTTLFVEVLGDAGKGFSYTMMKTK